MADGGGVHKQALTSITDLEGVLDEILARLPVKSLMRFRCVCKSWHALISQSHFVAKHFNYATKGLTETTSRLLISMNPVIDFTKILISITTEDCEAPKCLSLDCEALKDLEDDGDTDLAIRKLRFPVMFPNFSFRKIVGSCNGLICVEIERKDMVLWNPCTGEYNLLPKPTDHFASQFSGFGYDSTNDDYKVVRGRRDRESKTTVVQVFSLKSGSWRTHEGLSYFCLEWAGCLLNGVLHWLETILTDLDQINYRIVSFDLAVEKFQEMLSLPSNEGLAWQIIPGDCLGVYKMDLLVNESIKYRIWMMNECEVHGSWTEVGSLDNQFQYFGGLCMFQNGEGLIGKTFDDQSLVLFSFKEQTFRDVVRTQNKWRFDAVIYRESLVSPITSEFQFALSIEHD